MKIINKSGMTDPDMVEEFYVILDPDNDEWKFGEFSCTVGLKFSTELEATDVARPGQAVAKVTLVAKIV